MTICGTQQDGVVLHACNSMIRQKLTLVTVEIGQVLEELVSVAHQDLHYCTSLVGVCNKHLHEQLVAYTVARVHSA